MSSIPVSSLSGTDLIKAVRKFTGLTKDTNNFDQLFVDIISSYDINIIRVTETHTHQLPWAAQCGTNFFVNSTEGQSHHEMFQFYESDVSYGNTPQEAAFRALLISHKGKTIKLSYIQDTN